ncbi:MAG: histidinol-phosphate transaminase [Acidobacteria bacterium]|nr:MAG: histidinol-phosphate transaminase [Acidobacteriota bacterium]PYY21637.1 MAG: histidinol-phosphate transaminase [Acidobacteriota bacterium]
MEKTLQARNAVRRMKEYHPPLSGRNGLRLDFNENTDAPSPRVMEVLKHIACGELTKYPERAPSEGRMAEFLRLKPDQALLTNGVDEAIHLLCETFLEPGDEVLIVVPTFSMYEIYAQSTGARVITVQANPERGFRFPIEVLLSSITGKTRMIALASPNNPTGAVVARADLLRIADAAPAAAVLVDEAYYDFWGQTVIDAVTRFPNLFVTRTFSKAYGLAGLRIGVLAGNSIQMPMVRKVASPYNVNGIALACLPHAIADRDFLADYIQQVLQGRARLMIQLTCQGVPYWISQANFVLAKIGPLHREFVAEMRKRGILVRDRSSDPGCNGCVRMTVGTTEHTERLLIVLPEVLNTIGWMATQQVSASPIMGSV